MSAIGAHLLTCILLAAWTLAAATRDSALDDLAWLDSLGPTPRGDSPHV